MISSNISAVLQRLTVVEQRLPEFTARHLAAIPRDRFRAVAAAALAAVSRTAEERDQAAFILQSVLVYAPRGNRFAVGASFPDSPWQQAQRAGRELNRIFYKHGRPAMGSVVGETQVQRRVRYAGGSDAVVRLQRELAFARDLVQAFIDAPVTPDPEDPESGKLLDDEDRELLARPDPFGREANALIGKLMILLGFYPAYRINLEGDVKGVSPNFRAAAASITGRLRKFALAHYGGTERDPFLSSGRLADLAAVVLAAWRDLVLSEWRPATARALADCGWGRA